MINLKYHFLLFILTGFYFCNLQAQEKPFDKEIRAFKSQDSLQFPPANAILFVGSSSFRMWKDIHQAFPNKQIINRGFGGSSLPHVIQYADQIIYPYKPKQVVIYCGENDFTVAGGLSAEEVYERLKQLHGMIRKTLPKTHILFVSIKPSPSRAKFRTEVEKANILIRDFLKKEKRSKFVDIYNPMLQENGEPMPDLFLADKLHMNAKGYAIWQKKIKSYLK